MQAIDSLIIINSKGVQTNDPKGNEYYRNVRQHNISMTLKYFQHAQQFWASERLNGFPVELKKINVMTAANSVIPYNMPPEKKVAPWESPVQMQNRVIWYNIEFTINGRNVKTPWMCSKIFKTSYRASESAASTVAYDLLYADAMHRGVWGALKCQVETR